MFGALGMGRPRVLLCALACAALGSGACSLLLPFGDLSAGAVSDGGVQDATSGGDALPAEATVEAQAPADGGLEGEADGGDDASDAASGFHYPDGSWCSTQPPGMVLCDDFDFETTQFERWERHEFDVQGSASLSVHAESPPHAFALDMSSLTANTFFIEALEQDVAPASSTTSLSLSFAFQATFPWDEDAGEGGLGGDGFMLAATLSQGPGVPRTAVALDFDPTGTSLREQLTAVDGGASFPSPQYAASTPEGGPWTHVVIDLDFASATATLSLDGVTVITLALQGAWSPSLTTTVYLGDWYIHSSGPGFELLYDDAVIRQR